MGEVEEKLDSVELAGVREPKARAGGGHHQTALACADGVVHSKVCGCG